VLPEQELEKLQAVLEDLKVVSLLLQDRRWIGAMSCLEVDPRTIGAKMSGLKIQVQAKTLLTHGLEARVEVMAMAKAVDLTGATFF
ncbi:hypothetical protein BGZ93_002068, partial [Podila epicladia]